MKFLDLDKSVIKLNSVLNNGFYEYNLGDKVNITSMKRNNLNSVISKSLADSVVEDKFMIKYSPSSVVYFSQSLIDSIEPMSMVTMRLADKCAYIGCVGEFDNYNGLLMLSGYLSANGYIIKDRGIYCNNKMITSVFEQIRLLGVGVRRDNLYGLFYVPAIKGLKVDSGQEGYGISPISYKQVTCEDYNKYTIKDWFNKSKLEVINV